MHYFGLDFSINSPALCHFDGSKYTFYSFLNIGNRDLSKPLPKSMSIYETLKGVGVDTIFFRRDKKHADYSQDQILKIANAKNVAQTIADLIFKLKGDDPQMVFAIEGYSYGSKGNSFIDLIQFNSVLRNEIYTRKSDVDEIVVVSPSMVKKEAGKGNANKNKMLEFFLESDDELLACVDFFKWCHENPESLLDKKENVVKPVDDLVDSYFVLKTALALSIVSLPTS